jgi:hypothetical protein
MKFIRLVNQIWMMVAHVILQRCIVIRTIPFDFFVLILLSWINDLFSDVY